GGVYQAQGGTGQGTVDVQIVDIGYGLGWAAIGYPFCDLNLQFVDMDNNALSGNCVTFCKIASATKPSDSALVELWLGMPPGGQKLGGGQIPRDQLNNVRVTADGRLGQIFLPGAPASSWGW